MKVIKPIMFDPAMLIASNVPEDDYPDYDAVMDYEVGDRVVYEHVVYESAQTPNVGHQPDEEPLYWTYISATNRYRMFDSEVTTQTVIDDLLQVTVAPGLTNSLALLELQGAELTVVGKDGPDGPILYNHTQPLEGSIVTDWYEYFFEPFAPLTEVVLSDIPAYGSIHLEIAIESAAGPVAVGAAIFGSMYELGRTLRGPRAGIIDYSRKETSPTGATRFNRRRYSRRMSPRLVVENSMLERVYRILSDIRATPCVWVGTDLHGYGFLTVFGYYRDFDIDVAYPFHSHCTLEIEGLT